MKSFLSKLPEGQFVRIHKSYIVNLDKVNYFTSKDVNTDGKMLPLSRNQKNIFKDSYLKYQKGSISRLTLQDLKSAIDSNRSKVRLIILFTLSRDRSVPILTKICILYRFLSRAIGGKTGPKTSPALACCNTLVIHSLDFLTVSKSVWLTNILIMREKGG